MASIYKQTRKIPIPQGAEIITRRGRRLARWIDRKSLCKRTGPLSDDGNQIVVQAKWYTVAYHDHEGKRREVASRTPDHDAALTLAAKLETEAMQRSKGLIDPKAERHAQEKRRTLAAHVGDFNKALEGCHGRWSFGGSSTHELSAPGVVPLRQLAPAGSGVEVVRRCGLAAAASAA